MDMITRDITVKTLLLRDNKLIIFIYIYSCGV